MAISSRPYFQQDSPLVSLITWLRQCLPDLYSIRILPASLHTVLFVKSQYAQPPLKDGDLCSTSFFFPYPVLTEASHPSHSAAVTHPRGAATCLCSTSLRIKSLHKVYRILLHRSIACSSLFAYFMHSFISVWTHCLFYASGYSPNLLDFGVQIVLALAIGSCFSWFLCPFDTPIIFF